MEESERPLEADLIECETQEEADNYECWGYEVVYRWRPYPCDTTRLSQVPFWKRVNFTNEKKKYEETGNTNPNIAM